MMFCDDVHFYERMRRRISFFLIDANKEIMEKNERTTDALLLVFVYRKSRNVIFAFFIMFLLVSFASVCEVRMGQTLSIVNVEIITFIIICLILYCAVTWGSYISAS